MRSRTRQIALTAAMLLALVACATQMPDASLKHAIAAVRGTYTIPADGSPRYSAHAQLEQIVSQRAPRVALEELVECLDDTTPSHSTYAGTAVAVGVICHEAITVLAYHEPVAADGDIAQHWSGHVVPTATPDELKAAKHAWQRVLEKMTYHYL